MGKLPSILTQPCDCGDTSSSFDSRNITFHVVGGADWASAFYESRFECQTDDVATQTKPNEETVVPFCGALQ